MLILKQITCVDVRKMSKNARLVAWLYRKTVDCWASCCEGAIREQGSVVYPVDLFKKKKKRVVGQHIQFQHCSKKAHWEPAAITSLCQLTAAVMYPRQPAVWISVADLYLGFED